MASKLVMISVFVLNVIAFGLAVAAEQRRSHVESRAPTYVTVDPPLICVQANVVTDPNADVKYCQYDSDIATGYGLGAFFCLLASQALVMVASRCFCCGQALSPGGSRACAVILFIVCWLMFFIAEICLLAGSARNAYHTKLKSFYEDGAPSCETLRKGVFAAGAAFTFFTTIIAEFYYFFYSKSKDSFRA